MNELFRETEPRRSSILRMYLDTGRDTRVKTIRVSAIFAIARRIWFRVTYQHGRSRRIHRNGWRTGRRSSCRSRSCPPCYRTACPPRTLCTCCRGSTPRASAYPCTTSPANDSSADYRLLVSLVSRRWWSARFRFARRTSEDHAGDEKKIWMKKRMRKGRQYLSVDFRRSEFWWSLRFEGNLWFLWKVDSKRRFVDLLTICTSNTPLGHRQYSMMYSVGQNFLPIHFLF